MTTPINDDPHREILESPPSEPQCPVPGCGLTVDIILLSSNNTKVGAHKTLLALYSPAFPPCAGPSAITNVTTEKEVVELPETHEILEILMRYMHPHDHPQASKFKFTTLQAVAEAVEKYMITSAREICSLRMQEYVNSHPLEVLNYATKHNYRTICDRAAPATMDLSVETAWLAFKDQPRGFIAWVRWREKWVDFERFARKRVPPRGLHKKGIADCDKWLDFYESAMDELDTTRFSELKNFEIFLSSNEHRLGRCPQCVRRLDHWISCLSERRSDIPSFSAFLP